ncbi:MAG: bifunctional homocysteine S-methyltransferase/methylenetetrahydrofolate reductase [Candidatus Melainabacteria bacterium]|nr:MAG: bifunctional homocysteine S-methyltransferase/methylenetetrahydrofolate reductase [Candidatus Melainabacteria bacterium]
MSHPFLKAIHEKPLLGDGAMGTLLYERGASTEGSFEQLNLSRPELVQQVHIDYLNAGADVIETNSFSGNKLRLAAHGLDDQVWKLNVAAAKVARAAREVAGVPAFVAGAIGPTGKLLAPFGETAEKEMSDAFQEQMEALLAGGVDLFIIETMSSLEETAIAIKTARRVAKLPVVAQLSFSVEGHTLFGVQPEDAIKLVKDLGEDRPDVLGINCGAGPGPVFDSLLRMVAKAKSSRIDLKEIFFSCLPNAGQPSLTAGRYQFMSRPDYCASYVEPYLRAGARLIGGCCGTTPLHIRAMREAMDRYQASQVSAAAPGKVSASNKGGRQESALGSPKGHAEESVIGEGEVQEEKGKGTPGLSSRLKLLKEKKAGDQFFISVELDPPKGAVTRKILAAASSLSDAGADAINVGDSPMARVRMSSLATCQLISQKVGIDTIIHFTTRDRNLMGIQADLLGCQALGIRNILALTGDPPTLGNYVHATAVYDVDSVGLIKIITKLNEGLDIAGNSIGTATNLSIGCAVNPTFENRRAEVDRFRRKIEAGAHFAMTQPIYQLSDWTDFLTEFGECLLPVLVGIMPLHSFKHAEYLHNEVPGISIPKRVRDSMEKAGDEGARVGLELAEELLTEMAPYCQGTYLVPSFGRYDDMCGLVHRLKARYSKPVFAGK